MEFTPIRIQSLDDKRFPCGDCNESFSTRMVLRRHKRKNHSLKRKNPELKNDEDSIHKPRIADENGLQRNDSGKIYKNRDRFISCKEFNRLILKPVIEWSQLPLNCIYRLDHVDAVNKVIKLTNKRRTSVSVKIPTFVIDKLYDEIADSRDDDINTIYLRPKGEETIDIVTKQNSCKL